jgi:hypothetical protein
VESESGKVLLKKPSHSIPIKHSKAFRDFQKKLLEKPLKHRFILNLNYTHISVYSAYLFISVENSISN